MIALLELRISLKNLDFFFEQDLHLLFHMRKLLFLKVDNVSFCVSFDLLKRFAFNVVLIEVKLCDVEINFHRKFKLIAGSILQLIVL
jgi:hypothetical protein